MLIEAADRASAPNAVFPARIEIALNPTPKKQLQQIFPSLSEGSFSKEPLIAGGQNGHEKQPGRLT